LRGYRLSHRHIVKGLRMLRSFSEETEESLRMQSTVSPVWDTGLAAYALQEAGVPADDARIAGAVTWLLEKQITRRTGDWRFKALPGTPPGGWPFEHENDHYPDVDDTALAILALLPSEARSPKRKEVTRAIDLGVAWILGMQGSDGGWGAFDRDNDQQILNQIPFADLKSLLDPSTPDVTAHAVEALSRAGIEASSAPMQRALRFLRRSQERDGSWSGRWGVGYIYGTSAVLCALEAAGEDMSLPYVKRAGRWIESTLNADGGWGESCASYDQNRYVTLGHSTPSQTAWGLLGLLACGRSESEAVLRSVRFLLRRQRPDGGWDEPEWTGTGFPKHFYLRYDYYRLYFPLLALARFAAFQHAA